LAPVSRIPDVRESDEKNAREGDHIALLDLDEGRRSATKRREPDSLYDAVASSANNCEINELSYLIPPRRPGQVFRVIVGGLECPADKRQNSVLENRL